MKSSHESGITPVSLNASGSDTFSTATFTRKDVMDGLRELYKEWCDLKAREEGLSRIRLPDYEAMLDQIEKNGIPLQ